MSEEIPENNLRQPAVIQYAYRDLKLIGQQTIGASKWCATCRHCNYEAKSCKDVGCTVGRTGFFKVQLYVVECCKHYTYGSSSCSSSASSVCVVSPAALAAQSINNKTLLC